MANKGGPGGQRPIKGFRPGKEPPELRKRRAREQFKDMNAAQKRLAEAFAERTPAESRAMLRRQRLGFLAGGVALLVLAVALAFWSTIAAVVVAVLAAIPFFFWWRLNRQREALEAMADAVGAPGGGRRKG